MKDDGGQSVSGVGGYFTYDLTVSKAITGGTDTQQYRSTHISVEQDEVSLETDSEGNVIRNASSQAHALFKYYLNEQPATDSVTVYYYQDTAQKGVVSSLDEQDRWNPPSTPVDCWVSLGDNLSIRAIICAKDNRASEYRERQPRRMLVKNQGRAVYLHYCALSFNLVGAGNAPGRLREWAKIVNPATNPYTVVADWHVENGWNANSGREDIMNSDDDADEWVISMGPIPESNPGHNTVHENGTNLRWQIRDDEPYEMLTTAATRTGFTWCNADHSLINFGTAGNPIYREWRYQILNDASGDRHHPTWAPTDDDQDRSLFRIHEDGNYDTALGSEGCIALVPGGMQNFWNRLNGPGGNGGVWAALDAWDNDDWLPLLVYNRNGPTADGSDIPRLNGWGTATACHED